MKPTRKPLTLLTAILLAAGALVFCSGKPTTEVRHAQTLGCRSAVPVIAVENPANGAPRFTDIDFHLLRPDAALLLTDRMKEDYDGMIDAALAHEPDYRLSGTREENEIVRHRLREWRLNFLLASDRLNDEDGCTVTFTYAYSAEDQAEITAYLKNELLTALNAIVTPEMNAVEKVLAVYRYAVTRMEYDYDWLEELNASGNPKAFPDLDLYRGLSTGRGVCHTYAYLCEFLLRQLGVECMTLQSDMTDGSSHMWFCAKLDDGEFYHFDPTWENTDLSRGLRYFGMTDEERTAGGVIDYSGSVGSGYGPVVCTSERFRNLRDVQEWHFGPDHTLQLTCGGIEGVVIYNTATGERCDAN